MGASAITFGACPQFVLVGVSRGWGHLPALSPLIITSQCPPLVCIAKFRPGVESLGLLRPSSLVRRSCPCIIPYWLAPSRQGTSSGACFFVLFLFWKTRAPSKGVACGKTAKPVMKGRCSGVHHDPSPWIRAGEATAPGHDARGGSHRAGIGEYTERAGGLELGISISEIARRLHS